MDQAIVSIVVPAFNEARRIAGTIATIGAFCERSGWDWELRVVDDGSTDGTAEIAERFSAASPRVVTQREPRRGKGAAVRAGLCAARGQYRLMCDADLAVGIEEAARFLRYAERAGDVIIATREGAGALRIGEPAHRHLAGRLFNAGVRRLLLPGIRDTQCGFKLFTAGAVARIFEAVEVTGWGFDLEVLTIARSRGLRIVEVPVEWRYGADSRVRLTRDAAAMSRDLWRIRRRLRAGDYASTSKT